MNFHSRTLRNAILVGSVAAFLAVPEVRATNYYWDINGATTGFSSIGGTWNGTNLFWNTASNGTGGTPIAAPGSGDDLFVNGGTTGTITISGAQSASSITLSVAVAKTISGGTSLTIGGTGTNSGLFATSATGATTISTAIILNAASAAITYRNTGGAVFTIGATTGAAGSGTQTISAESNGSGLLTLNGAIGNGGGGGNVAVNYSGTGAGGFVVSGNSGYSGGTTINSTGTGILAVTTATGFGSGTVTINGGSIRATVSGTGTTLANAVTLGGNFTAASIAGGEKNLTFSGPVTLTGSRTITANLGTLVSTEALVFSGAIGDGGSGFGLTQNGTGNLKLSGANTYRGDTIISNGKVILGNTLALQNSAYDTTGSTGAIGLTVTGFATPTLGGLKGAVNLASAITGYGSVTGLTLNPQSGVASYSGVIADGSAGMTLTKTGAGTQTLSGANAYTGATQVTAGTLTLSGSGSVNNSSGITVSGSGAKFLQTSSVAVTPAVTLTQGTLTGSGTVNTVNVGAGTGGIISNNDGVSGAALTIGNLTLAGAANLNLFSNTTAADLIVTGTLTTAGTAATITANNVGGWTNGSTYNLLTYGGGSIAGSGNNFAQAVNNLSARQSATWGDTGSAITLAIAGDNPYWVGDTNGNWNTTTINNWRLVTGGGYTTFLATDDALFNNNATGTRTIDITEDVAPNTVVFDNNGSNPYTIDSVGGFGINSGSLTKIGAGTVKISTNNSYSGVTTLNNGVLRATTSANALGSGTLTLTGGELQLGNDSALNFGRNTTVSGNVQITSDTLTAVAGVTQTLGTLSIGPNTLTVAKGATATGSTAGVTFGATTFTAAPTFSIGADSTLTLGAVNSGGNTATITGAGNLLQSGVWGGGAGGITLDGSFTGLVTLNQANTFTGPTLISAGTLQIGSGGTTGSLSPSSSITNNGTLAFNRTNTITQGTDFASVIGGTGGVTQSGSGTLILNGANTYGSTLISAGTVQIGSGGATGTLGSGAVTNNGALVFNRSDSYTVSNAIGGSGSLSKQGAGVLTLSVANGYAGTTTITTGALIVTADGGLGTNAGGTTIAAGRSLGLAGGIDYATTELISGSGTGLATATGAITSVQRGFIQSVSGNNTFRGNIELNANGLSRIGTQTGASLTLTGAITQATGITTANILFRVGDNAGDYVTLSNAGNSFGGDSQIFTGATAGNYAGVRLGITNALPTNLTISAFTGTGAGTALDLAGYDQSLNGLTGTAALNIINTNTGTPSTLTLNPTANKTTAGTLILGGGGLGVISVVKDGIFTQTLSGANTYSGSTTVSAGTLEVSGSLTGTTGVSVNTGGTLLLSGTGGTNTKINPSATMVLGGGTLRVSDTISSTLDQTLGTLTLSASSIIDFGTFASGNTFRFADSASLFASWSGTLSIHNWTDGADHLFFGNGSGTGLEQSQLDQIKFFSDAGATILPFAPGYSGFTGSFGEVVPVPEPSSVATVMGLLGLVGWREGRRQRSRRL